MTSAAYFTLPLILLVSFVCRAESTSENVLVIGDSHACGSFGTTLVNDLAKPTVNVDALCAASSSPENWIKGTTPSGSKCESWSNQGKPALCDGTGKVPTIKSILAKKHYSKVIIELGTNSLLESKVDGSYANLAKALPVGTSCAWIGPPHIRADQARGFAPSRLRAEEANWNSFNQSLTQKEGSRCDVVDSGPSTAQNTPGGNTADGVHRNKVAASYWANAVAQKLNAAPNAQAMCEVVNKAQQSAQGTSCINP